MREAWIEPKPVWRAVKLMLGIFCRARPGLLLEYVNKRYAIPGSIQSPEINAALKHSAKLIDDPFSDEPPEITAAIARTWLEFANNRGVGGEYRGVGSSQAVVVIPSAPARKRQRSKYGAVKTGGYASKREARRAAELKLLERAGVIRNLREQVEFELIPKQGKERPVKYRADFVYDEAAPIWTTIVEDNKGYRTADYIIKRKLMLFIHGIAIRET